MVFLDVSTTNDPASGENANVRLSAFAKTNIAPVSDRILALLLDGFIFFPIFSLLVAGMTRELRVIAMAGNASEELSLIWLLVAIAVTGMSVISLGLFIHFWGGTPGQRFMQLKVVAIHDCKTAPGLGQSFTRVFLWWLSILSLGIPFLEVLSHPLRRSFHERATDTMVISAKTVDVGPHPLETKFIHSWVRTFSLMIFFVFSIVYFRTYQSLKAGYFAKNNLVDNQCADIPKQIQDEQKRVDLAVGMYMSSAISADCVEVEARAVLWSPTAKSKSLAYLAMSLVNPDETLSDEYQAKVCLDNESEACAIVKYLDSEDKNRADLLRKKGLNSITSRMMLLEQMSQEHNYASAMALIEDLKKEKSLDGYLSKQSVRNMWALNEKLRHNRGRSPASAEESDLIEAFKREFEIP